MDEACCTKVLLPTEKLANGEIEAYSLPRVFSKYVSSKERPRPLYMCMVKATASYERQIRAILPPPVHRSTINF